MHENGIKLSIYIDDGRFLAKDLKQANCHRELVYDTLIKAGWQISHDKSDGPDGASTIKEYLGFVVDTQSV